MRIDLHLHTNASDGSLEPGELVQRAAAAELDIIAITDHDTASGIPAAQLAAAELAGRVGPEGTEPTEPPIIIPGIEVSSTHQGNELHILGYAIDPAHPTLATFEAEAQRRRAERMQGMIERLAKLGLEIEYDDVLEAAGKGGVTIGRPHLARALVARGYLQSVAEAFDRFLGDDKPAFIPTELMSPRDAIEMIEATGGLAVWAHPPLTILDELLDTLVEWGLQGIECHRPRNTTSETRRLTTAAAERDLLITGGSDWHGDWNGPLGSFTLRREQIGEFIDELGY